MTLTIWRFSDGKPGHDSQSIGLCSAIEKERKCHRIDIAINPFSSNILDLLFKRFPAGENQAAPNIMIGAGHGTHLPMLAARRARGGKIIVLMKPSLPLSLFDMCIIPGHDMPPQRDNVIATIGALNPIQFNQTKHPNTGLILLGGISKHYQWGNDLIIDQIHKIISKQSDIKWAIADSPRTPDDLLATINKLDLKNADILPHGKTNTKMLHELIFKAKTIWVSKDSISMIYESLSSGAEVGLLNVAQKNRTRLSNAVEELINAGRLTAFEQWENNPELKPKISETNEAKRCTQLLIEKGLLL